MGRIPLATGLTSRTTRIGLGALALIAALELSVLGACVAQDRRDIVRRAMASMSSVHDGGASFVGQLGVDVGVAPISEAYGRSAYWSGIEVASPRYIEELRESDPYGVLPEFSRQMPGSGWLASYYPGVKMYGVTTTAPIGVRLPAPVRFGIEPGQAYAISADGDFQRLSEHSEVDGNDVILVADQWGVVALDRGVVATFLGRPREGSISRNAAASLVMKSELVNRLARRLDVEPIEFVEEVYRSSGVALTVASDMQVGDREVFVRLEFDAEGELVAVVGRGRGWVFVHDLQTGELRKSMARNGL